MVSLAEGVIKIKAPLLFVVPRSRGYSFRKDQAPVSTPASGDAGGNQAIQRTDERQSGEPGGRQEGRFFPGPGRCHHSHHSGHIGLHLASCRRLFRRKFSGDRSHAGHLSWLPGSNDHLAGSAPGGTALPQFRSDFWIPGGLRSRWYRTILSHCRMHQEPGLGRSSRTPFFRRYGHESLNYPSGPPFLRPYSWLLFHWGLQIT